MCQHVLPKSAFESMLPDGWFLSRLYRNNRILYYRDIKVARIADTFDVENVVSAIINNPPECVQEQLYLDRKIGVASLSETIQKKLIRKGVISIEVAKNCLTNLSTWLSQWVPKKAEYAGKTYYQRRNRWYDDSNHCINATTLFLSTWDARIKYAQGQCTLSDVARYSWAAVLECLGDDHQRFIDTVLQPKLKINKKARVVEAKTTRDEKLKSNLKWKYTSYNAEEQIMQEYQNEVEASLEHYFYENLAQRVQMFTDKCNVPAFKNIRNQVACWEEDVIKELSSIIPELSKFRWNSVLREMEPVFAPQPLSYEKKADLYHLIHQVITGQMSGYQAALYFVNADWKKIKRESNRYEKHLTQHVPYYSDRWKKLDVKRVSFASAVQYVQSSVKDIMKLGYRAVSKSVTSFNYDDCRFSLDVETGRVSYLGIAKSKYMSDSWLKLKPEQRRQRLDDDVEWEYQEKAIKSYNRLFSYLYNVVHKHWDRASYYLSDKLTAKKKYLRPSSRFLDKMREKAEEYIKSLERRVVTC